MSFVEEVQYTSNGNVMVGCGCKTVMDVVTFIREKKIEFVELAWADEMGLWHNQTASVADLTYASFQEGVPCKDGRFLIPDPLSARIAPRSQPNTMLFTCKPPTSRSHLKTKHLNPEWIEMISKKLMENENKRPSISLDKNNFGSTLLDDNVPRVDMHYGKRDSFGLPMGVPTTPPGLGGGYASPGSPGCVSSPGSSPGSPSRSPVGSPGAHNHDLQQQLGSSGGFIEWKLVRNDPYGNNFGSPPALVLPPSPTSDTNSTPPSSVPGSPCLPASPRSPVPDDEPEQKRGKKSSSLHVPPLLRPRQIHPTKAHKLGITKPVKKRRNTEHLYCRHCGTTETPEWRRGPDGRKSLCNACGLYYSKMIKRETMVVPQSNRVAIDALLNPHS